MFLMLMRSFVVIETLLDSHCCASAFSLSCCCENDFIDFALFCSIFLVVEEVPLHVRSLAD